MDEQQAATSGVRAAARVKSPSNSPIVYLDPKSLTVQRQSRSDALISEKRRKTK
jgi:hypothetical protein